ncbi:hypothetical protein YC2023_015382 [Brassica napus]
MVSQIVWPGVRDVFTQIAKDVVGQGIDHGRRSPSGLLHNQCGVSGGTTAFWDVTKGKEKQKPASRMVLHKACYVNFRKFLRKTCVVCVGFTRNVSSVISILGESCLELLMECYRSLFHYDPVAEQVDLATIGRKASLCARCYIYSRVFFVTNVFDAFP